MIDRYLAITQPLTYGVRRTTKRILSFIGAVWIASCLISIPPVLILGNEHGTIDSSICEVSQNIGYQLYATLGAFYIPLGLMIFMYYKIYVAAKRVVEAEMRDQRPSCSSATSQSVSLLRPSINDQQQQQQQTSSVINRTQQLPQTYSNSSKLYSQYSDNSECATTVNHLLLKKPSSLKDDNESTGIDSEPQEQQIQRMMNVINGERMGKCSQTITIHDDCNNNNNNNNNNGKKEARKRSKKDRQNKLQSKTKMTTMALTTTNTVTNTINTTTITTTTTTSSSSLSLSSSSISNKCCPCLCRCRRTRPTTVITTSTTNEDDDDQNVGDGNHQYKSHNRRRQKEKKNRKQQHQQQQQQKQQQQQQQKDQQKRQSQSQLNCSTPSLLPTPTLTRHKGNPNNLHQWNHHNGNQSTKLRKSFSSERNVSLSNVNYKRRASNALRERKASFTLGTFSFVSLSLSLSLSLANCGGDM